MEIGPGTGAVTAQLHRLGRPLTLVELDEMRISHLEHSFPRAQVRHADVLTSRLDQPVIAGSLPFHLTTPILRRLLRAGTWQNAILVTQWEVARKRAGVGGSTMMTAQWAPWFDFRLITRVPAHAFTPIPSVDGGILTIDRSSTSLVPDRQRSDYQQFVRAAFTGRGRGMKGILSTMNLTDRSSLQSTMDRNDIRGDTLPRDLTPDQWAGLYSALGPTDQSATGELPSITEKPVITGEFPIVGADQIAKKLEAQIPGVEPEVTTKSHDKGHLQAERGFMPQHGKKSQPQPRWNLPRR